MQAAWRQQFRVALLDHHLIVTARANELRVALVNLAENIFYFKTYSDKNTPAASKHKFASAYELYTWLERFKQYPQSWAINQEVVSITFQTANTLRITLERADKSQIWGIIVSQICEVEQHSLRALSTVSQEVQRLKQRDEEKRKIEENSKIEENRRVEEKSIVNTSKLKSTEVIVKEPSKQSVQNKDYDKNMAERIEAVRNQLANQIKEQNIKIQSLSAIIQEHKKINQKSQQDNKQLKFQLQLTQKTQNRNFITIKQQLSLAFQSTKQQLKSISQTLTKADLDKMKRDTFTISQAFQHQIRIKDYFFQPDPRSMQINNKIYFLNSKNLKCMQDTKDYFKIASAKPLPFGRYQLRMTVLRIKNNGLLIGICSAKVKAALQHVPFNDRNMLTINSCGYLVNQGLMTSISGKIKSGDNLRMVVGTSTGEIRWYCNDVEIAGADLGQLRREELFVVIGLGNFGDQVEVGESEEKIKIEEQINESYRGELDKLNRKFGSGSRRT